MDKLLSPLLKIWYYRNLILASAELWQATRSPTLTWNFHENRISCSWRWGGSWIMDHAQRGEVDASVDDRDLPNSFLLLPQFSCRARNLTSVVRNATYHHQKTYHHHHQPERKHISSRGCFHIGGQSCSCVVCCAFWSKTSLWYFDWQFQRIEHQIYFPAKNFFTLTWNLQKSFNFVIFFILSSWMLAQAAFD